MESDSKSNLHRITAKLCLLPETYLMQECSKEVPVKYFAFHYGNVCRKLHSHRCSRLMVISNESSKSVNEYNLIIMEDSIALDYLWKQVY